MKLQDLIGIAYKEWGERDETGHPEEVRPAMQEFENKLEQVVKEVEERMGISELNEECAAVYEAFGFREGFKAAVKILQAFAG